MRKMLYWIVVFVLFIPCAGAENIDFSRMSLSELTELRTRIQLAMMETDEWQEVTVPQGVYEVGKDIPSGTWTVKSFYGAESHLRFAWGDKLDDAGQHITYVGSKRADIVSIFNEKARNYKEGDLLEYTFTCQEGDYIVIEYTKAIFTPYHGKPDLGFK